MGNLGLEKSEAFGVKIVNLFEYLKEHKTPYPIIEQITKSGTSIGANLNEANCAISDKDFFAKTYISLKECSETLYWLRILYKTNYLHEDKYKILYEDAEELFRILSATTKTLRKRLNSKRN